MQPMSYPLQLYNPNRPALIERPPNRAIVNNLPAGAPADLMGSLFGIVNELMGEILRSGPGGLTALMGSDPNNPHIQMFGISSMNVTQISRGPDGRPHIVQAHDERRMGPGGIYQTKRALRDPERGIEKMQVGYFAGDRAEIIERRLEPSSGQYREEVQHLGEMFPTDSTYSRGHNRQHQSSMPRQQYPFYRPTQAQTYRQPALPAPPSYRYP